MKSKYTLETFMEILEIKRPGLFDASKSIYVNQSTLINILCLKCNNYSDILPKYLLSPLKNGECCKFCQKRKKKITIEDYRNLAESIGWSYSGSNIPKCVNFSGGNFVCPEGHIVTSSYSHIQDGRGCPTCSKMIKLVYKDYINVCGNKGRFLDEDIPKNNKVNVNWLCFSCNKNYNASYHSVDAGHWCGCENNVTMKKLKLFLEENYPDNVVCEFKPNWIHNHVTNRSLSFDYKLIINNINIIVELDGAYHFKELPHTSEFLHIKNRRRDIYKMKKAIENDFKIIRIYQPDVFFDKNDWKYKLNKYLNRTNLKDITYISSVKNIYDTHKYEFDNYDNMIDEIELSLLSSTDYDKLMKIRENETSLEKDMKKLEI